MAFSIAQFDWPEFQKAFREEAETEGFTAVLLAELDAGPLIAWTRAGNGPNVYLSAGIHGDEPAGPLALLEMMREGFFCPSIAWSICPALNPSGLINGTRENYLTVDLNRDYLTRRSQEIVAHAGWLDALGVPDLFISLHEDWETTGFYFYEINLHEDHPERAQSILDAVNPWFQPEPGQEIDGHEVRELGWIYHPAHPDIPEGWPEAIFLANMGCPISFTFETPSHAPLHHRVAAHQAAVRIACSDLIKRGASSEMLD